MLVFDSQYATGQLKWLFSNLRQRMNMESDRLHFEVWILTTNLALSGHQLASSDCIRVEIVRKTDDGNCLLVQNWESRTVSQSLANTVIHRIHDALYDRAFVRPPGDRRFTVLFTVLLTALFTVSPKVSPRANRYGITVPVLNSGLPSEEHIIQMRFSNCPKFWNRLNGSRIEFIIEKSNS